MMRFIYMLAVLILLTVVTASAQSFDSPAPDIAAGKKRAAVCFACHSPDGISKIQIIPNLAGQKRAYLEKALRAYRDGQRQDPTMSAMAKPLSDADIVNIATYFSVQPLALRVH